MSSPAVSVILTTFNGAKYIKKQIDSILNQTLLPTEIVICDDKSTDDTTLILKTYAENTLIKLYINDQQLGVVKNFQKAAKLVSGFNYIVFADQDDIWVSEKLQVLVNEIQLIDDKITPALVYSDLKVIDKNDLIIANSFWDRQQIQPQIINWARILYGNAITGCTMIINHPMKEEFLSMEGAGVLHDEWLALIAYSFGRVAFTESKLVLYRQHENNITYAERDKEPGFWDTLRDDLDYFFKRKKFLQHQFHLVKAFFIQYRDKLSTDQLLTIENFIKLEDKNYLTQRISRRKTR